MYRLMQPSDWAEVLALWQAQRGDTEEFVRGAVERFAGVQNVYVAEENDHIEAVALAVPVTLQGRPGSYLFGLCGQGSLLLAGLVDTLCAQQKLRGAGFVVAVPASPEQSTLLQDKGFQKAFALRCLPREVERVLYLDPDMLIINPLRPLWEMDLYGKTFAAASHTGLTEMANGINQMRLDTEHEYFNSGVMLIDLTAARKLVTAEDVFACVSEHEKELILPDQDVFNILYGKETRPVEDVLWNYDVRNYSKYLIRSAGKHDLSWVMRNTAVLHFCGRNKPWHEDYKNPFGMLYLHYMNLTLRKRYA